MIFQLLQREEGKERGQREQKRGGEAVSPHTQTSGPAEVTSWMKKGFCGISHEIHTAYQTHTHSPSHKVLHSNKGNRFLTSSPIPDYIITIVINTLKEKYRGVCRV